MKRTATTRADALPALAEVFREHGFEGASLAMLCAASGLGKGSMYNFFPGGKQEMLAAVIADVDQWFAATIFAPLQRTADPSAAIAATMREVTGYFRSGRRACLIGWTGLGSARDVFAGQVETYFVRWISALTACLQAGRVPAAHASRLAEEAVSGIQGAIVLARALGDEAVFARIVGGHQARLLDALARAAVEAAGRSDAVAQRDSLGR